MPPAIRAEELTKSYGTRQVLGGVSFEVQPGEVLALLGRNGAGKTTTIEILEGYRAPDAGRASILGDQPPLGRETKAQMGVMLEELGLYPGLTVTGTLKLFASFYPRPLSPADLIDRLELRTVAQTKTRALSMGERQRLSLALALIGQPSVLFLDEPTAGADPVTRKTCLELIREISGAGGAVLLTTHHLDEAEQSADKVAILAGGTLQHYGPMSDLPGSAVTIETDRPLDLSASGVNFVLTSVNRYTSDDVLNADSIARITALAAEQGVLIRSIDREGGSLESIFLRLTSMS